MHYVVQLKLPGDVEKYIHSIQSALSEGGISLLDTRSHGGPHVTVMSSSPFPRAKLRASFAALASSLEPFEITFSHIGFFPAERPVLFFGITPTATLTALHRRLYELVSEVAQPFDFVRPDVFVFHCTLGFVVDPEHLPAALERVWRVRLPGKTRVESFEIVAHHTCVETLETFSFGAKG